MNRYEPLGGGQTKKATWPLCELRVSYKCQLCESEHQAIARSRGIMMDAELSKRFMNGVKVDLVNKFFQEHPKAKLEDFEIDRISAEELITHEEGEEPEKDDIGVPWTTSDIESLIDKRVKEPEKLKKPSEKEERGLPKKIITAEADSPLEKMDFAKLTAGGMELAFRERLEKLIDREKQLGAELLTIQCEKIKLEAMVKAAEEVEKIEPTKK